MKRVMSTYSDTLSVANIVLTLGLVNAENVMYVTDKNCVKTQMQV